MGTLVIKITIIVILLGGSLFMADRQFVKPWRDLAKERAATIEQKDKELEHRDENIRDIADFITKDIHEENHTIPSTLGNLTTF